MTYLEKLINEKGPILSSELIKSLSVAEEGISKEAIRKRLSRLKGDVFKIRGLFSDGQILFLKQDIYGTEEYYNGLHEAFKKAGKQYYTILQSLDFHFGYIKAEQLASYSVNPVLKLKGHLTFETAIDRLIKLKVVHIDQEHICISGSMAYNSLSLRRASGVDLAKNFLLIQFNDWTRKIGLVSYNTSKFHSEFGKYQFNFVSPSYVGSLTRKTKDSIIPAFVVADILIGNTINESQVEFFINKVRVLKFQKGLAKFIPFLIVDSIDTKALNKLKSEGIVIGFVNELFGNKYTELLNSLINLVTNAGAILKKNPEAYLDLIINLNKLVDGKTNNLRGDLFELAVGYHQGRICQTIDIGKLIIHEGVRREIDVFGLLNNSVIVSECKGYKHPVSKEEIEVWLGEKVPIIRKWILDQPSISDREITFEFWSTGGYTNEARVLLEKRKNKTKKYNINYFDLEDMIIKSKELNSKKFTEILREYYVKEV
mgnify:CR=1 FL=1